MIRGVIFDIDGTLVDSVDLHAQAWCEAFAHFGKDVEFPRVRHQIGKGGDKLIPEFLSPEENRSFGKELEDYREELFKRKFLERVQPFPRVRALFERCKEDGKRIALASSTKQDKLQHYLEITRVGDLIEGTTTADDAQSSKPDPDILAAALKRLEPLEASQVMVVGDTPYDAEAASKLDLRTIGVRCGGFPEEELRSAGCIALYDDPADLLRHYDSSPLHQD